MRLGVVQSPKSNVTLSQIMICCRSDEEIVFLVPSSSPAEYREMIDELSDSYVFDDKSELGAIVDEIALDGLTTFDDRFVATVHELLGSRGMPGGAGSPDIWDKFVQRRILNQCGASDVGHTVVETLDDLIDARRAISASGYLKPRRSAGGAGIVRIVSDDDSAKAFSRISTRLLQAGGYVYEEEMTSVSHPSGDWLAPFVSVDSVVQGGTISHIVTLDKLRQHEGYIEAGDVGPSLLPKERVEQIHDVVTKGLRALEIDDRQTHTEVRFTRYGPQIVEVNGRQGGDVARLAANLKLPDLPRLGIDVALGNHTQSPTTMTRADDNASYSANIRVPISDRGLLDPVTLREVISGLDDVEAIDSPGDLYPVIGMWLSGNDVGRLPAVICRLLETLVATPEINPLLNKSWVAPMITSLRQSGSRVTR